MHLFQFQSNSCSSQPISKSSSNLSTLKFWYAQRHTGSERGRRVKKTVSLHQTPYFMIPRITPSTLSGETGKILKRWRMTNWPRTTPWTFTTSWRTSTRKSPRGRDRIRPYSLKQHLKLMIFTPRHSCLLEIAYPHLGSNLPHFFELDYQFLYGSENKVCLWKFNFTDDIETKCNNLNIFKMESKWK